MDGTDSESRANGQASGDSDASDDSERVEHAFQQWSRRVSRFLTGAAARAREEAEDIVAEAQSIRRGERE